jgi:hypothetical protein
MSKLACISIYEFSCSFVMSLILQNLVSVISNKTILMTKRFQNLFRVGTISIDDVCPPVVNLRISSEGETQVEKVQTPISEFPG